MITSGKALADSSVRGIDIAFPPSSLIGSCKAASEEPPRSVPRPRAAPPARGAHPRAPRRTRLAPPRRPPSPADRRPAVRPQSHAAAASLRRARDPPRAAARQRPRDAALPTSSTGAYHVTLADLITKAFGPRVTAASPDLRLLGANQA